MTYIDIKDYLMGVLIETEFFPKVYCVGECVRDYLLGLTPERMEIVVEMKDGEKLLTDYLWKYGYLASLIDHSEFRLSKYSRTKIYVYSCESIEDDWRTKIFTMNALYHNLWLDKITDPSGEGLKDLEEKNIKVIDEIDLFLNPLQILKAIKFAVNHDFQVDGEIIRKYSFHLEKYDIKDEVEEILESLDPKRGLELMGDTIINLYLRSGNTINNLDNNALIWNPEFTEEEIGDMTLLG